MVYVNVLFVIVVLKVQAEEHCIEMSGHTEKKATCVTCVQNGIRQSYDVTFKLMTIIDAKTTNNYKAARKLCVAEAKVQRWKEQKQKLTNANSIQKSFSGPKHGHFQEL